MKTTYKFTRKEKELLLLFKKRVSLNTADSFAGWRDTKEFESLEDAKLIFHSNSRIGGDFIKYYLTELGESAINQLEP